MATVLQVFDTALKLHQAGNLVEAERLYREILRADPRHADAWHLLGLVAHARGDFTAALEHIGRAIEIDPAQPSFHNHRAEAHRSLGQLELAEASSRRAIELRPDFFVAHNTLGIVLDALGRGDEAIASYRQALALRPDFAQAHHNLGLALHARGYLDDAIASYRQAIACKPDYLLAHERLAAVLCEQKKLDEAVDSLRKAVAIDPTRASTQHQLGLVLESQSKTQEAIAAYRKVVALDSRHAEAHCKLGGLLGDQGQLDDALEHCRRAIAIDPHLAEAHFNLGRIYQKQEQFEAAGESYRRAIELKPESSEAYNNLGTLYRRQGKLDEAVQAYQRALELQPDFAEVLSNLGNVFRMQGRRTEAMICYDHTLRLRPDHALTHTNRAMCRLACGDYAGGWAEYEWRWKCEGFAQPSVDVPVWDGSDLAGRTLLVHSEQGLGDTLQLVRYLPLVEACGGQVVVEVQPPLVPLLVQSGFRSIVPKGAALPHVDLRIGLMSLPRIFHTTLDTIPSSVPYLAADPALVEKWRDILAGSDRFKIGIAWQGSTIYQADRFRSIPLEAFQPLAMAGVELIRLQKGFGSEQLDRIEGKFRVRDFGSALDRERGAFMDTAAIMKNLDLVVTSDTVTAHLAGGLSLRAWVALPFAPDWRWHHDRSDSPWYPSLRLFRQPAWNNWQAVFERMAKELRRELG